MLCINLLYITKALIETKNAIRSSKDSELIPIAIARFKILPKIKASSTP